MTPLSMRNKSLKRRVPWWLGLGFLFNLAYMGGVIWSSQLTFPRSICRQQGFSAEDIRLQFGNGLSCDLDVGQLTFYLICGTIMFSVVGAGVIEYARAIRIALDQEKCGRRSY
jgi:hypothetical protein